MPWRVPTSPLQKQKQNPNQCPANKNRTETDPNFAVRRTPLPFWYRPPSSKIKMALGGIPSHLQGAAIADDVISPTLDGDRVGGRIDRDMV